MAFQPFPSRNCEKMKDQDPAGERPKFSSRIARPSDLVRIVRLCERAVGPNDYVISSLNRTIRRRGLFLAFSKPGDELIGISNLTFVFDGSGWLGMARTDPKWRGQGVAQFLQSSIARYAKNRGSSCLRFFVHSTNRSSLRAARKGGFRKVAECAHVSLNNLAELPESTEPDERVDPGGMGTRLLEDPRSLNTRFLKKMNGYIRYGYAFVRANRENLAVIKNRGELHRVDSCSFVLVKTGNGGGEFGLVRGAASESFRSVILVARRMNLGSIGGFIPMDQLVIHKALSSDFMLDDWGSHAILFEKSI